MRHGARTRALVFWLSLTLASFAIAAAGHHHDRAVDAHICAICAVLVDELPNVDHLPPVVTSVATQSYVLLCVIAYVCWHCFELPLPPSCGPPHVRPRPEVAVF